MDLASGSKNSPRAQDELLRTTYIQPDGFPKLPHDWKIESQTYPSKDKKNTLFASTFRKEAPTTHRALIVLHGQAEHGGRYLHFPHYLKNTVDVIFAPDIRGHGRSSGLRGHVDGFDDYVADCAVGIERFIQQQKTLNPKTEFHLFGHSMGGLIALLLLLKHPEFKFKTVTASAPALALAFKVNILKEAAAWGLSKIWGSVQMPSDLDIRSICRDEAVRRAYREDQLVHRKVTPRFYFSFLDAMKQALSSDLNQAPPLLFVVPMADEIISPDVAVEYYEKIKPKEKKLATFADFYHESFNEIGKEQAFEVLTQWIESHD